MAVWYLAHENELLLDIDQPEKETRNGGTWLESFTRHRLVAAHVAGKLNVSEVYIARSNQPGHVHVAIRLRRRLPLIERMIWQLHLGSDLYRGRADAMRAARGLAAPSLLIRSAPIPDFYRLPDRTCTCIVKHDTETQAALGDDACKVWRELRGMSPWELFGAPPDARILASLGAPWHLGRMEDRWMEHDSDSPPDLSEWDLKTVTGRPLPPLPMFPLRPRPVNHDGDRAGRLASKTGPANDTTRAADTIAPAKPLPAPRHNPRRPPRKSPRT